MQKTNHNYPKIILYKREFLFPDSGTRNSKKININLQAKIGKKSEITLFGQILN
jgi:hypothetical protein